MSNASKLRARFAALPPDARAFAAELLAQIAHDMKGPLATVAMDCFSAKMLLAQASQSPALVQQLPTLAKQLDQISSNLERASNQLSEYLAEVSALHDSETDPAPE